MCEKDKADLLDAIFQYNINGVTPTLSPLCQMAFNFIKSTLDRDNEKYCNIVKRNQSNGKLGGRPKKPKKPSGLINNPKNPVGDDSDNDSDSDNKEYINKWNSIFDTNYTSTESIKGLMIYWKKIYSIEQICKAIENIKFDEYWGNKDVEPVWLLRKKDSSGEVDRIGKFLNQKNKLSGSDALTKSLGL